MLKWLSKNKWLALGLVAVMLFTLLPTNLNWADIAISEPEKEELNTAFLTEEEVPASEEPASTEIVQETSSEITEGQDSTDNTQEPVTEIAEENTAEGQKAVAPVVSGDTSEKVAATEKQENADKSEKKNSVKKVSDPNSGIVTYAAGGQYDLNVTQTTVTVNGEELKDGDTVKNGDSIVVELQFRMDNSADVRNPSDVYEFDLAAEGITMSDVERGNVLSDGRVVGYYTVKDGKLTVVIEDEVELQKSDLTGKVTLQGTINVDEDKIDENGQGKVKVADKECTVTVIQPDPDEGHLDVSKNRGGKITKDGNKVIQEYTITIRSTGENTDIDLKDIAGSNLDLVNGSITVTPQGAATITPDGNSFKCHIDSMKDGEVITITYQMEIDAKAYAADSKADTYSNHLEYNYEDNKGNNKTENKYYPPQSTADVQKPHINKGGSYDANNHEVEWTITITGNDLDLDGATILDQLGQYLEDPTGTIDITLYYEDDWNGEKVTGVTFDDLKSGSFTIEGSQDKVIRQCVIKYRTKVDEDYTGGLEEKFVENTTTVTVEGNDYTDKGEVGIGREDLVEKDCTTSNGTLEGLTEAPYELEWKTTITVPKGGLKGLKYTDSISQGHKLVTGSIQVTGASYSSSSQNENGFTIDFGDVTGPNTIIITYKTECTNLPNDALMDYTYRNDAKIEVTHDGKIITQTDNANYHYSKDNILSKDMNNWIANRPETKSGEVNWLLTLNVREYEGGKDLVITDTLPVGMRLKEGSARADYQGSYNYDYYTDTGITVTPAGSSFTITVTADYIAEAKRNGGTIWILYTSECEDLDARLDYENSEVVNRAQVKESGSDTVLGSDTAGTWFPQMDNLVQKSFDYSELTAPYVNYRIEINKEGLDLLPDGDTLTVIDEMGAVLSLDPSSFVIYQGDGVTELDKSQYELKYEPNTNTANGVKNRITVTIPDEMHLIIEYRAKLTLPEDTTSLDTVDATNTVRIEGFTSNKSQSSNRVTGNVFESSAEMTSETGSITLWKYNEIINNTLGDAEFDVWMVDSKTFEPVKAGAVSGYEGSKRITSNASGTTVISGLIKDHIYAIQEVKAPSGYRLDNTVYWFLIKGHDDASLPENLPDGVRLLDLDDSNITYFNNVAADGGYFNIGKKTIVSGTGTYLQGATLALYKKTATGAYETEPSLTFVTGKTTKPITVVSQGTTPNPAAWEIEAGTYKLVEIKVPAGYKKAVDIVFTVDTDGNVTDVTGSSGSFSAANKELVMVDAPVSITIEKKKGSVTGGLLSGAVLTLTDEDGNVIKTIDTTKDNPISITGLVIGKKYTLTETTAPEGYDTAAPIEFSIDANGNVTSNPASEYVNNASNTVTMVDKATRTPMHISKRTLAGTTELAGARLAIYKKGGSTPLIGPWTSGASQKEITICLDAVASKNELEPGDYVLKEESAPQGYIYSKDIEFTVTKDGKVIVGGEEADDNIVIMRDAPYSIYLDKRDISDDTSIEGAEFVIMKKGDQYPGSTPVIGPWTSDSDIYVINGSKLVIGQEYTLIETKAPTKTVGSTTISFDVMDPVDFVVEKDGSLRVTSTGRVGDDVTLTKHGTDSIRNQMILYNKAVAPGNFEISKQEALDSETEIIGVKFKLYNGTEVVAEWTTGSTPKTFWVFETSEVLENSNVSGTKLLEGTYRLVEEEAPFGYVTSPKEWTFTISLENDGTAGYVTITPTGNNTNIEVKNRRSVTVVDKVYTSQDLYVFNTMKTMKVSKKAVSGIDELPGATLRIYKKNADGDYELVPGMEWISGDDAKTIRLDELGEGEFRLEETAAPNGYAYAESIEFKINSQGEVSTTNGELDKNGTPTITMRDALLSLKIQKIGTDDDASGLAGAKLHIEDENGNIVVVAWDSETGAKEIDCTTLAAGKNYVLVEESAPAGYTVVEKVPFTINPNGTIALGSGIGADATVEGQLIKLKDKPIQLTIRKETSEGTALEGATLRLYDGSTVVWSTENITADEGIYTLSAADIKKLQVGKTYRLVEVTAPKGFAQAQPISFKIEKDGSIVRDDGKVVNNFTIVMVDQVVGLTFLKRSSNGGEIVKGARLRLEKMEANDNFKAKEWTTSDIAYNVPGEEFTPGNRYRLSELIAPNGYKYTKSVVFTYVGSGKVQLEDSPTNASATGSPVEISLYDDELRLYISKIAFNSTLTELKGAEFKILDADNRSQIIDSWISDGTPHRIALAKLKADHKYVLVETTAPKGYKISAEVEFTVDKDGVITTASQANVITDTYNGSTSINRLRLRDSLLELKIAKVDEEGGFLPGATLELWEKDGNLIQTIQTSEDGAVTISPLLLTGGMTYVLKETKAPQGYGYSDDIEFTIEKDGTVKVNGVAVQDNTVEMVDYEIGVQISKEDMAGRTVKDAHLTITTVDNPDDVLFEWDSGEHPKNIPLSQIEPDVEYVLTEVLAPDGYAYAESITFKVDEKGNVYVKVGDEFVLVDDKLIIMKDKPLELYIRKFILGTETMIAGAKFVITDKESNKEVYSFVSGTETITVPSTVLKSGDGTTSKEYILSEIEAPEGYALAPNIEFAIDRNGNIWVKNAEGNYEQDSDYTLDVYDEKDSLMVSKHNLGGEELAGATFTITSEKDMDFKPITIVSTTTKTLVKLDVFKRNVEYILTEAIAPDGYAYADSITFTIDEAGTVYVNNVAVADNTLVVTDANLELKVAKMVEGEDKFLAKAELSIIEESTGNIVYSWKTKKTAVEIPVDKVKASTDSERIIYILRETKAPRGYALADDIRFYIDKNGNVYTLDEDDIETLESDHTVTMYDEKEDDDDDETGTKTATKTNSKKTGDSAPIAMAGVLLFLSLTGAGVTVLVRRRKRK